MAEDAETLAREYAEAHADDFDCGCGRCDVVEMQKHASAAYLAGYQSCADTGIKLGRIILMPQTDRREEGRKMSSRIHDYISNEHSQMLHDAMQSVFPAEEEVPEWVTRE